MRMCRSVPVGTLLLTAAALLSIASLPALAGGGVNASAYGQGDGFYGRRTACGNIHSPGATTAHKSLPCGTRVLITNTANGKSGVVTVTDRGPFVRGREWDLNSSFARQIGLPGIGHVKAQILGK